MIIGVGLTASVAVAIGLNAGVVAGPVASNVWSAGGVMAGAVVSWTFTLNDDVDALTWLSVAVQVTKVVPIGKVKPDAGLQIGVTDPSTKSLAVGLM